MLPSAWAQGRYRTGDVVPEPYLKVFGSDGFFRVSPISEPLKETIRHGSLKSEEEAIAWDELRYLQVLHRDADGNAIVGEMVCAASIADDLLIIFKELYRESYPIEKMRLIDFYDGDDEASMRDNNSSCFNQRKIPAGGIVSKHSFGLAVDINPKYNPYYKLKNGKAIVKPEESVEYLDRRGDSPYMIRKGDPCHRLFKQHGFHWGGDWGSGKDFQHFEK